MNTLSNGAAAAPAADVEAFVYQDTESVSAPKPRSLLTNIRNKKVRAATLRHEPARRKSRGQSRMLAPRDFAKVTALPARGSRKNLRVSVRASTEYCRRFNGSGTSITPKSKCNWFISH